MTLFSILVLVLVSCAFSNGQGTNFVDKTSKLVDFHEPQWFVRNIPFLEVPDKEIEEVFYYRFSSLKRHLRYTLPGAGYIVTEFVHGVGYAQKFDTINAAAGHHIDEARWLRDTRYVKDYINVWAREGAGNQQYSEWIADASYNAYLVNGDLDFIKSQQEGLVTNFNGWNDRFEPELDLYFLSPHDDAMEHSASSGAEDNYHGGLGYRPSFNAEMYANAIAISKIALLNGDSATATEFQQRAEAIRKGILAHLWDKERTFFYHVYRENNTNHELLDTREEIGFFPWRWSVPDKDDPQYEKGWEHLFDPEGFKSEYGPTTCEQRSQWFLGDQQPGNCCWWNGNSWPYSTGHTLRALASQVKNYASTALANVDSFYSELRRYAVTQYKNGKPYVAECHSALYEFWVCDGNNWSEHYAHSTYTDNVLADLIGIEPQADDTFQVNPLVPSSWKYFIAENIPYHGHSITVLYDADGTKYQTGNSGLHIFVNGELAKVQPEIGLMKVDIPPPVPDPLYDGKKKVENYAANVNANGYPKVDSSYSSSTGSNIWEAVDGRIYYDFIPTNRWSNYGSPNFISDWFSIDFGPGRKKTIDQVKVYIYSDFGVGEVDCPTNIVVEYLDGSDWKVAENQVSTPPLCARNDLMTIEFKPITVQQVRLQFTRNLQQDTFIGVTEIEIWAPWPQAPEGVYEAEDGLLVESNMLASSSASSGSYVEQTDVPESTLEFTGIWSDAKEERTIQIHYANAKSGEASVTLITNNVNTQKVTFPVTTNGSGNFDSSVFVEIKVPLQRGNNVLIFKHDQGSVEIDKLTLI